MKRLGNIWDTFVSKENLQEAFQCARKGKMHRPDVRLVCEDPDRYIDELHDMLVNGTFHSSEYMMFKINEKGKVRDVADLPFYPDRIVHWAVMLVLHRTIMRHLIHNTYAALPGRGSHMACEDVFKALHDRKESMYFLKLDVKKYFPSIDKDVMMAKLRTKVKDERFLEVVRRIIYEYPYSGLPIGNYTSQYFANFYLSELDHYMKERFHCKYYFRYMDDIVILGRNKSWLHRALKRISRIIGEWGLTVKGNWCIRPTSAGIDFVGYVIFPEYRLLRKRTKVRMKRATRRIIASVEEGEEYNYHTMGTISSYDGCLKWCDGYRLGQYTTGLLRMIGEAGSWNIFRM